MRIGYACLAVGVPETEIRGCILKNASDERLNNLIYHNLISLENIIDYNIRNNILLFRISSDLIPFGSSPANKLDWWKINAYHLNKIGRKILDSGMRVSMHPGQYTVLNSPDEAVVSRAVCDLDYHAKVLDSLGVGPEHKIILHIGGCYKDKQQSAKRFCENYARLGEMVKQRLVIENDDKIYNIGEVLDIGTSLGIPVVFDNLHNAVNPCRDKEDEKYWINKCSLTWQESDGGQKIHYSQQDPLKKPGAHSERINVTEFLNFCKGLGRNDLDIMLEVKDKNLSALKCIHACTNSQII